MDRAYVLIELTDTTLTAHAAAISYEATDIVYVLIKPNSIQRHLKCRKQNACASLTCDMLEPCSQIENRKQK